MGGKERETSHTQHHGAEGRLVDGGWPQGQSRNSATTLKSKRTWFLPADLT